MRSATAWLLIGLSLLALLVLKAAWQGASDRLETRGLGGLVLVVLGLGLGVAGQLDPDRRAVSWLVGGLVVVLGFTSLVRKTLRVRFGGSLPTTTTEKEQQASVPATVSVDAKAFGPNYQAVLAFLVAVRGFTGEQWQTVVARYEDGGGIPGLNFWQLVKARNARRAVENAGREDERMAARAAFHDTLVGEYGPISTRERRYAAVEGLVDALVVADRIPLSHLVTLSAPIRGLIPLVPFIPPH